MTNLLQRVALGFVVAVLVAVAAGWTVREALRATQVATEAVTSSATFLGALDALHLTVVQAENRVRGFALTGDANLLTAYARAAARFEAELAALRERREASAYTEAIDTVTATFARWEEEQATVLIGARAQSDGVVDAAAVRAYGAWLAVAVEHASLARGADGGAADVQAWRIRLEDAETALRSLLAAPLDATVREIWSDIAVDVQAYRRTYEDAEGTPDEVFADTALAAPFLGLTDRFAAAWAEAEDLALDVTDLYAAGVGGDLVMSIREIVDEVRATERTRLAVLVTIAASRQERADLLAWLAPLAAVVVSSLVVVAFISQLLRHVTRLGDATRDLATGAPVSPIGEHGPVALRAFTRDFDRMAERVRTRDREAGLLAELAAMAHAARSIDEAIPIAGTLLPKLLPGEAGALWLVNPLRDGLERSLDWGQIDGVPLHVGLDGCWALRQGKAYRASGGDAVRCSHDPAHGGTTLCVPLFSRDVTLGVLSVRTEETAASDGHWERLTRAVSEQMALAIANLLLRDTLKEESIRDGLTGLYNRRFLETSLALEVARAGRSGVALSMMMVDVDHFKRFNDAHGHDAGDAILRAVGRVLSEHVRSGDIACRFGGEEFALLLPGANDDVALERAERLRDGIESVTFVHFGVTLPTVTASVGVATVSGTLTTPEALVRRADEALYAAKEAGRNRVVAFAATERVTPADD